MDAGDQEYAEGSRAMRERRYTDAVYFFSRAVFLCPSEPLPYISRAEAYVCLGDVRSAIANYRKALSMIDEGTASAADLRRRLSQLLDAAGVVAFAAGNTAAAIKLADEALAESYHPLTDLHKAIYLIASESHGAAEGILRKVLEESPEEVQPEASTLLARLLISTRRDFGGAKALIDEMVAQFPNNKSTMQAQLLFSTAFARFRQNAERSLDAEALTKAIDAFPDDAELYYSRALAYCESKEYTMAVQDLFVCVNKSDGTHPNATELMSRVLATIADDLAAADDFSSAIHFYTESLKWCGEDTPNKDVLIARGDCFSLVGKHEEALVDLSRVHALDPLHEGARSRLGQLHDVQGSNLYNQGKFSVAEVEFTKAIEYFDQNIKFFYHRALSRGMLGKGAMMVRDLMSCRDLGTDNPQILSMVQQFCTESTAAETRRTKDLTAEETAQLEEELKRARELSKETIRRRALDARSATNNNPEQERLSSLRTNGKDALDGGVLTPANIRHFVRNMQVGRASGVVVQTNAITNQKTINGRDASAVEKEERYRPHWAVSQKPVQSRLDKVQVSKPSPPPRYFKFTPPEIPQRPAEQLKQIVHASPMVGSASASRKAPLAPLNKPLLPSSALSASSNSAHDTCSTMAHDNEGLNAPSVLTGRRAPISNTLPRLINKKGLHE